MSALTETKDKSLITTDLFNFEFCSWLPEGGYVLFDEFETSNTNQIFVPETIAQVVKYAIDSVELKNNELSPIIYRQKIAAYCVVSDIKEIVLFPSTELKKAWTCYIKYIPLHLIAVLKKKEKCRDELAPLLAIIRGGNNGFKNMLKIIDVLQNMFVMDREKVLLVRNMRK
jgi:hypothetical protein